MWCVVWWCGVVVFCVVLCCVVCCVVCGVVCCLCVFCVVCVCAVWRGYLFHGFMEWCFMCGCWFQGLVWTILPGTVLPWTALPLDHPSPGTPKNFALFFFLSRRKIRSFLPSLGVFSLKFGGVFEGRGPQIYTFGLSGWRVKPRRLRGQSRFGQSRFRPLTHRPFLFEAAAAAAMTAEGRRQQWYGEKLDACPRRPPRYRSPVCTTVMNCRRQGAVRCMTTGMSTTLTELDPWHLESSA